MTDSTKKFTSKRKTPLYFARIYLLLVNIWGFARLFQFWPDIKFCCSQFILYCYKWSNSPHTFLGHELLLQITTQILHFYKCMLTISMNNKLKLKREINRLASYVQNAERFWTKGPTDNFEGLCRACEENMKKITIHSKSITIHHYSHRLSPSHLDRIDHKPMISLESIISLSESNSSVNLVKSDKTNDKPAWSLSGNCFTWPLVFALWISEQLLIWLWGCCGNTIGAKLLGETSS